MGIGARLRDARKEAGLTIQDLSARTKIQPPLLSAIERDDFHRLPGGPVRRGFLRAYAREVGLDPEAIVREYRAEFEAEPVQADTSHDARATTGPHRDPGFRSGPWLVVAIAVALIVLISHLRTEPPPLLDADTVPTAGMPGLEPFGGPDVAPAGLTGHDADARQSGWLSIDVEASRTVWVEASADGQRVVYRLVEAGERLRVDAREELVIRVGDAGAVRYSINGEPGRPLGGPGQVATLRITPENQRTFVAASR